MLEKVTKGNNLHLTSSRTCDWNLNQDYKSDILIWRWQLINLIMSFNMLDELMLFMIYYCWFYSGPKCKDPGIPKNGRRDGSLFLEGTQVRFSCNEGYEVVGFSALSCVLKCRACKTGQWNGATPTCEKIGNSLKSLWARINSVCQSVIHLTSLSINQQFGPSVCLSVST